MTRKAELTQRVYSLGNALPGLRVPLIACSLQRSEQGLQIESRVESAIQTTSTLPGRYLWKSMEPKLQSILRISTLVRNYACHICDQHLEEINVRVLLNSSVIMLNIEVYASQ